MSTKTTIKRIALVAAVAAAFGGLSTVAANASVTITPTTTAVSTSESYTVGTYNAFSVAPQSVDSYYTIASSGVGSLAFPATGTANLTHSTVSTTSTGAIWSNGTGAIGAGSGTWNSDSLVFTAYSSTAGTQTITVTGSTDAAQTYVITWGAAPSVNAQYSQVVALSGSTYPAVTTAGTTSAAAVITTTGSSTAITATGDAAGTQYAAAGVAVNASASAAMPTDTISATITGPGTLAETSTTTSTSVSLTPGGRSLSLAAARGTVYVGVFGDGTAGTATVTITDTTNTTAVQLGTFTVTFVGAPTKVTATQNLFIAPAAGGLLGLATSGTAYTTAASSVLNASASATPVNTTSNVGTYAVTVKAADANGNAASLTGWTPTITNSNSAVVAGNSCAADAGNSGAVDSAAAGVYYCSVSAASGALSGQTATVTWTWTNSAGTTVISTAPVTFTIGGAVSKVTIAADASSYSALAPLKIVATAKDSSGNLAYDQDLSAGLFTSAGLVSSIQLGGTTLPANSAATIVNGVHTYSGFYAPATAGGFTISGTDSTSNANAVSLTATSTGGSSDAQASAATDAANEATDAANAATDAANAAADAADAATTAAQDAGAKADAALAAVTALSAKITVLAAQIAKIVKKLGA